MSVFEAADFDHHETVAFFDDKKSGLKAIIAIHSTALGAGCGALRRAATSNPWVNLRKIIRSNIGKNDTKVPAGLIITTRWTRSGVSDAWLNARKPPYELPMSDARTMPKASKRSLIQSAKSPRLLIGRAEALLPPCPMTSTA